MSAAALVTRSTTTKRAREVRLVGHIRLLCCGRCGGRRRALREQGGVLVGCCLRCGLELHTPLDTEPG